MRLYYENGSESKKKNFVKRKYIDLRYIRQEVLLFLMKLSNEVAEPMEKFQENMREYENLMNQAEDKMSRKKIMVSNVC